VLTVEELGWLNRSHVNESSFNSDFLIRKNCFFFKMEKLLSLGGVPV